MTPIIIYDADMSRKVYGKCPVQSEGTINGHPFYFRSRHEHWYLAIASTPTGDPLDSDAWMHCEEYRGKMYEEGNPFGAGWAEDDECVAFIERVAQMWLDSRPQGG